MNFGSCTRRRPPLTSPPCSSAARSPVRPTAPATTPTAWCAPNRRWPRPPAHPAQPRHRPRTLAPALPAQAPRGADRPVRRRARAAAHRRAAGRPRRAAARARRGRRPADGGGRLPGPGAATQRRAEHVALWALAQLGLPALLESLGVNAALRDAALGSVVARMAFPASERDAPRCAGAARSASIVDFETVGAMPRLGRHGAREGRTCSTPRCSTRARRLFDLTNTYLEGDAAICRRPGAATPRRSAATVRC